MDKIQELSENPFPSEMKKLKDGNAFRIRAGKFRVLYMVNVKEKIILIAKIDKRPRVYGK